MDFFNILIPLLITILLTFFIGFERQNIGKSAGVSAHVFIALASCGLALLQGLIFKDSLEIAKSNPNISISIENQRIIAQIVSGVGFIGAGIIMKEKDHISGLTTATTLWASAIIGLIIGMKYYLLGITLGVIIILFIYLRDISRHINPLKKNKSQEHDK